MSVRLQTETARCHHQPSSLCCILQNDHCKFQLQCLHNDSLPVSPAQRDMYTNPVYTPYMCIFVTAMLEEIISILEIP